MQGRGSFLYLANQWLSEIGQSLALEAAKDNG